jgi:hypothetical protein
VRPKSKSGTNSNRSLSSDTLFQSILLANYTISIFNHLRTTNHIIILTLIVRLLFLHRLVQNIFQVEIVVLLVRPLLLLLNLLTHGRLILLVQTLLNLLCHLLFNFRFTLVPDHLLYVRIRTISACRRKLFYRVVLKRLIVIVGSTLLLLLLLACPLLLLLRNILPLLLVLQQCLVEFLLQRWHLAHFTSFWLNLKKIVPESLFYLKIKYLPPTQSVFKQGPESVAARSDQ